MTVTRSQTGATPRRSAVPEGFVETPGRRTRNTRKSANSESVEPEDKQSANGNGASHAEAKAGSRPSKIKDHKVDNSGEFEFGGTAGVTAIMVCFPVLMYYMWIGATYYDGRLPLPAEGESLVSFFKNMLHLVATGAYPSLKAWAIYWVFFVVQCVLYLYMPGVYTKGKPLEHLGGKQLDYYCSGVTSFYSTIVVMGALHYFDVFHLWTLMDEFGPLMSVAIISGIAVSVIAYVSAIMRGEQHRMTGYLIYDFFMGAELNPRMFKWLDFKMFFEVRLPWFILFFITLGGCARQYEQYGYVSGEMLFVLMAHWLYANACCKGEEMIPITWDMYYEKWGFMLIFWNMAGVPLSYCHCSIYLANHAPEEYRWPRWFLAFLFASYLFMYWVWDSCASQKNGFRAQQRGTDQVRASFPQLPWRRVKNPRTIPVPGKDPLFADGWYRYARKIHYTADMWFAICWGLICGFNSPFPWFYAAFFAPMIAHRATRDLARCRERYGAAWDQYEKECPYLFIPWVY